MYKIIIYIFLTCLVSCTSTKNKQPTSALPTISDAMHSENNFKNIQFNILSDKQRVKITENTPAFNFISGTSKYLAYDIRYAFIKRLVVKSEITNTVFIPNLIFFDCNYNVLEVVKSEKFTITDLRTNSLPSYRLNIQPNKNACFMVIHTRDKDLNNPIYIDSPVANFNKKLATEPNEKVKITPSMQGKIIIEKVSNDDLYNTIKQKFD